MTETVSFAGFTTKGLEDVAADELREVWPMATIRSDRPKMVRFDDRGIPQSLANLRCFDDLVVEVAAPPVTVELDDDIMADGIAKAHRLIESIRPVGEELSITVSAIRRDRAVVDATTARVVEVARAVTGLRPKVEGRSAFDVRLQIDADQVFIGVRLFECSLSDLRPARTVHRLGGLRPTVAAAMVRIATNGAPAAGTIWDPFCGSGTILAEAADAGHAVIGSDIDPEAVDAALRNLAPRRSERMGSADSSTISVSVADALKEPFWGQPREGLCLVTNLPWNKQVPVNRRTRLFRGVGSGLASLSNGGSPVVVLTTDPGPILAAARREGLNREPVERRLGFGGQTPTLLSIT